jgi:PAS domain S-box-containing protein
MIAIWEEAIVVDEGSLISVDQFQSALDRISDYIARLSNQQPDPDVIEEINRLKLSIQALSLAEDELHSQNERLIATQQEADLDRQRYRDLFSFAPTGYLVTNIKGVIQEANREASTILNTPEKFLLNMPLSVFILRSDWRKFLGMLNQCRAIASSQHDATESNTCFQDQELQLKPLRSRPIIALVSAAYAIEKKNYVLRWSIRNVTNQRLAQQALSESEMKFRNLAESTAGAILIVQEGRIMYVNQAFSRMVGVPLPDLFNRPFEELIHPLDRPVIGRWKINSTVTPQQKMPPETNTFRQEVRFLTTGGQECWVDLTAGQLSYQSRPAWVITAFDISARIRTERARTDLLYRLVNAQEEERQRIARELHDQVGQMISAINLGLTTLDGSLSGEAQEKLVNLRALVNDLSLSTQHLALGLRPSALDDLGLVVALTDYLEEWSQRTHILVDFQCNIPRDMPFPPEFKIAIYRIVQEALTNIQKHASASNVSVIINQRSHQLIVVIEDNGRGFPLAEFQNSSEARKHLGLVGMKERAELIRGRLEIESSPGKGTSIIIRAPV